MCWSISLTEIVRHILSSKEHMHNYHSQSKCHEVGLGMLRNMKGELIGSSNAEL